MNDFIIDYYKNSKSRLDILEIVSEEIKKRLSEINKNIRLAPAMYKYLLLEYLSDLCLNIYFSSLNKVNQTNITFTEIHLFASISDTLNSLHTSKKYNLIIRSILKSHSSDEIKEILNLISYKIIDTSILAPKFHNNPLNYFSKNKLYLGSIGLKFLEKFLVFIKLSRIISKIS
ncbi:hypothetical protein CL656_06860, partial [bacterium]|nr:hypothetical protein [bacterium]